MADTTKPGTLAQAVHVIRYALNRCTVTGVPGINETVKMAHVHADAILALVKQREQLLAACRQVVLDWDCNRDPEDIAEVVPYAVELCRAAIARAEKRGHE